MSNSSRVSVRRRRQFMSRAEVSGQVEGLFSAVVHMEMRGNEVNTVNFTSLCTVIVIKGTRGN